MGGGRDTEQKQEEVIREGEGGVREGKEVSKWGGA